MIHNYEVRKIYIYDLDNCETRYCHINGTYDNVLGTMRRAMMREHDLVKIQIVKCDGVDVTVE